MAATMKRDDGTRQRPRAGEGDGPITRARIVRLALEIADREELGAVSFRRLGEELGVTPMALYHHVRDKADLLAAMIEEVMAEVELPPAAGAGGWAGRLRAVVASFLAAARRHPCTGDLLRHPPGLSPHVLRLTEGALELLRGAGFEPEAAIAILQQLGALVTSQAALRPVRAAAPAPPPVPDGSPSSSSSPWAAVPRDRYPRMHEAAAHLGRWDQVQDLGIDMLVLGIEGLRRQAGRAARPTAAASRRRARRRR
jgi:AcrR family transcriptional regulator